MRTAQMDGVYRALMQDMGRSQRAFCTKQQARGLEYPLPPLRTASEARRMADALLLLLPERETSEEYRRPRHDLVAAVMSYTANYLPRADQTLGSVARLVRLQRYDKGSACCPLQFIFEELGSGTRIDPDGTRRPSTLQRNTDRACPGRLNWDGTRGFTEAEDATLGLYGRFGRWWNEHASACAGAQVKYPLEALDAVAKRVPGEGELYTSSEWEEAKALHRLARLNRLLSDRAARGGLDELGRQMAEVLQRQAASPVPSNDERLRFADIGTI